MKLCHLSVEEKCLVSPLQTCCVQVHVTSEDLDNSWGPFWSLSCLLWPDINRVCEYMNQLWRKASPWASIYSNLLFFFFTFSSLTIPRPWPLFTMLLSPSPNLNPTPLIHFSFYIFIFSPPLFRLFHEAFSSLQFPSFCQSLLERAVWLRMSGRQMKVFGIVFHYWSGYSERVMLGWRVKCAEKWVMMPVLHV